MTSRTPYRTAGAGAATLALLLAGCGGDDAGSNGENVEFADGGTFTWALSTDPGDLDPHLTVLSATGEFNVFTYDPLINLAKDGEFVSGIATSWEVDATTGTFTLRDDVTCDDGHKLTPSDVAANLEFLKDPDSNSPLIPITLPSKNYTVAADDAAGTVTVTLAEPYAFLETAMSAIPIVCPSGLADRESMLHDSAGTGPFSVVEAVPGDHYTLEKREGYTWGPDGATNDTEGFPDKVEVRIVTNETTAANLLLAGDINAATVAGADRERLEARDMFSGPTMRVTGEIFFNQGEGHIGADESLRRALTQVLKIEDLMRVATGGRGEIPSGMVSIEPKPCEGNTVEGHFPEHDVDAAKQALVDAGWTEEDGKFVKDGEPLRLRMLLPSDNGAETISAVELAAQQWNEELGIEVDSTPMTDTALISAAFEGDDWDAAWLPVNATLPTVLLPFLSGPEPPEGQNFAGIDNPDYNRLVEQARVTPGEAGCELWNQAESALFEQVDLVPISATPTPTFGAKARFDIIGGAISPTTVRLVK